MRVADALSYNVGVTTAGGPPPHFATAGLLLDALAGRDVERLGSAVEADGALDALLPSGLHRWRGLHQIREAFWDWFGDAGDFEMADASVGSVGPLLQLRWRLRVRGRRTGGEPAVVEQHAYAATGPSGRIQRLSLLCSGLWKEGGHA